MRLDADLGIDSIKRVEILSAVQDRLPEAPTLQPEQLGTIATLRQIVELLVPTPPCPAAATAKRIDRGTRPVNTNGVATKAPSENGTAVHTAKENGVPFVGPIVLRTLHPRPVPLEAADDRPAVKLPAGGTVWITDDGSRLTDAASLRLARARLPSPGDQARRIGGGDTK